MTGQLQLPWLNNCNCHPWTTAVAMTEQLQLPSLDNCGCHPWKTAVAIRGQLRLQSMDNCSCHVWSNVIAMYKQPWMASVNKSMWHGWTTACCMLKKQQLSCIDQLLPWLQVITVVLPRQTSHCKLHRLQIEHVKLVWQTTQDGHMRHNKVRKLEPQKQHCICFCGNSMWGKEDL